MITVGEAVKGVVIREDYVPLLRGCYFAECSRSIIAFPFVGIARGPSSDL
jgi:hypothetical protein